jgi:hypothetical protein
VLELDSPGHSADLVSTTNCSFLNLNCETQMSGRIMTAAVPHQSKLATATVTGSCSHHHDRSFCNNLLALNARPELQPEIELPQALCAAQMLISPGVLQALCNA